MPIPVKGYYSARIKRHEQNATKLWRNSDTPTMFFCKTRREANTRKYPACFCASHKKVLDNGKYHPHY